MHKTCLLLLALLAVPAAQAQRGPGDLLVAPTRIVFEGRQRTAEITLVNVGATAATYRISLIHLRMDEDGGTREIAPAAAAPGELFADGLIRFSPRQVTLEPKAAQTVRLQLRKPAELATGEYRSHLLFRAVPPAPPVAAGGEPPAGLSIQLTPVYGVSIPILVRQGQTAATATLSDLRLEPTAEGAPVLRFRIHRTGNRSVYGDLQATFLPDGGKAAVRVGRANGVAVYTPNADRACGLALQPPPGMSLGKGLLRLSYTQGEGGKETLAQGEIRLP